MVIQFGMSAAIKPIQGSVLRARDADGLLRLWWRWGVGVVTGHDEVYVLDLVCYLFFIFIFRLTREQLHPKVSPLYPRSGGVVCSAGSGQFSCLLVWFHVSFDL
jgi:hypothetical protein